MQQFFRQPKSMTVGEVAALTGAEPRAGTRLDHAIHGIAALDNARPVDLAFLDNRKHAATLATTRAGVCIVGEKFEADAPASLNVLRSKQPFRDFITVARALYPDSLRPNSLYDGDAIGAGAQVHPTAELEDGVTVDPGAVVGPRACIGAGTVVGANAVIGPDVQIGRNGSVGPGATVLHALIGDNVILHPGCRIGQDGFRYHGTAAGHIKVPQLGRVIIQDNAEIGAGTAIDRGGLGDTVIGEGTKIDNLVQIGHNCMIGRHCIVVSHCGLSGSVTLGDYAILGGKVGVADHVIIGEGVRVAAGSGVMSDIPAGETWMGYPAMPGRRYLRVFAGSRKRTD